MQGGESLVAEFGRLRGVAGGRVQKVARCWWWQSCKALESQALVTAMLLQDGPAPVLCVD